jgi:hypothetical protein
LRSRPATIVAVLLAAAVASAQPRTPPRVGVFFDAGGLDSYGSYSGSFGSVHAYLFARDIEHVGAVRLGLVLPPFLMAPADSLILPPASVTGDLTEGIQIDYEPVLTADNTGAALLGEFEIFYSGGYELYEIEVGSHPDDTDVLIDVADGQGWTVAIGLSSLLLQVDPVEERSWGEAKALYR